MEVSKVRHAHKYTDMMSFSAEGTKRAVTIFHCYDITLSHQISTFYLSEVQLVLRLRYVCSKSPEPLMSPEKKRSRKEKNGKYIHE